MSNINKEQQEKLIQLIKEAIEQDKARREKYHIGEKFRFIRDRLTLLLANMEESLTLSQKENKTTQPFLLEDEQLIYIYIFNAQGLMLQSWQKMLNPAVFYEYSVNRPIYLDKSAVEAFIRTKTNKFQHGYLTIAIKQADILSIAETELSKDAIGNPLTKVREGSLHFKRFMELTYNGHDYILNEEGQLVKKE